MIAFCENCREMTNYSVVVRYKNKIINEKQVNYITKQAKCSICYNEVFVKNLRDKNLASLINSYNA